MFYFDLFCFFYILVIVYSVPLTCAIQNFKTFFILRYMETTMAPPISFHAEA